MIDKEEERFNGCHFFLGTMFYRLGNPANMSYTRICLSSSFFVFLLGNDAYV
jgi:hypothetical protein